MTQTLEIRAWINQKLSTRNTVAFLIIFYTVGVFGLGYTGTRDMFIRLMPLTILLSIALLFHFHTPWKPRHVALFALIAITGYLVEVAGVITGHVFGEYQYHHALGVQVFGTPLLIGVNWLMLTYCVYVIGRQHLNLSPVPTVLTGASLKLVYDYVMEPVAIRLDMWTWAGDDIPLQNYVAWFVISVVFLSLLHIFKIKFENKLAAWLFGIQFLFFLSLNITLRFL
jgi:bisanhydrobacterioruberin hydratase